MAAQDRIRLTGPLREGPPQAGPLPISRDYPGLAPYRNCAQLVGPPDEPVRTRTAGCRRRPPRCEHVFALIVCVLLPRFELAVAAGGREALAAGPVALAPETGPRAADRRGLRGRRGLRRARRPAAGGGARALPDAAARRARPGRRGRRVGARARARSRASAPRSSPSRPGIAWFDARGLRSLHGGTLEGVLAAARRALARPGAPRARRPRASPPSPRPAAPAPAAPEIAPEAPRRSPPISRRCRSRCSAPGRRSPRCPRRSSASGSARSASSPRCPRAALADRFGAAGPLARDLARGQGHAAASRARPAERLEEVLELPESASGPQLERALGLLIDRAARPPRAARAHAARRRAVGRAGRGRDAGARA